MDPTIPRRWVIGRGLLGNAVIRSRVDEPHVVSVPWHEPGAALRALGDGAAEFLKGEGLFEIYWCAGRGVTSTPPSELNAEVGLFRDFLAQLPQSASVGSRISLFLASSVGGAYAGSIDPPFSEQSTPAPLSAYGRAKLEMESILRESVRVNAWRGLVARITNVYGPGQDLGKGQGLISVIVDSYVTGAPVSVYVPLDTLRDYIYEDDCGRVIEAGMRRLQFEPQGRTVTKIVGAMATVSIGAILGENARLRRRRSRIVLGQGNAVGQAPDLRVRSTVWPELDGLVRTTFAEGLDAVYRAQLLRRALGKDS